MSPQAQIATTIVSQLGGRAFVAMTGAKNFVAMSERGNIIGGVTFSLPRFPGVKVRRVAITLNGSDLYDIVFFDAKFNSIGSAAGVYAEDLLDAIAEKTGLAVRMPRITFA